MPYPQGRPYGFDDGYLQEEERDFQQLKGAVVVRRRGALTVRFPSDLLFSLDSSTLGPVAKQRLNKVADTLKRHPDTQIQIRGYTDTSGSEDYNLTLSNARAAAVSDYLIQRGVSGDRIESVGFGPAGPIASNLTADAPTDGSKSRSAQATCRRSARAPRPRVLHDPIGHPPSILTSAPQHATLYEQTLALTWTFPLRAGPEATVRPIRGFFAGLVAARREVWLRFPFNSENIRYRGMCVDVARRMQKAGIRIQLQPDAKGAHPPPRGPREFAARALTEGRDRFFRLRATRGRLRSLFRLWAWFWRRAMGGNLRILRLHDQVGMKASGVPAAWVINTSYFGLGCAAGSFMFLRPSLVEASLREQRQEESPAVR